MNDDGLRHAAFYLSLDKDEMQNVLAEHRKADARRKAALAYGDSGSPQEPIHFAPLPPCVDCEDPLSHDNRSGIAGLCITCLTQRNAKTAAPVVPPKQPTPLPLWFYPTIILAAVLFGGAVGWILPRVAWRIGTVMP